MIENGKKQIEGHTSERSHKPIKKINKRILRERARTRKGKIALTIFFIIVTSPLWLYVGIVRETILPSFGEKTKGVLTGINKSSSWNKYRYNTPFYYCTFSANGEIYKSNPTVSVKDTSFHLGDTVDVIYLKNFPFINAIILSRDTN